MREKVIEQYLRDQVKSIGGKAYKFVSPGNAGVPDRLICLPGGVAVFVELKAPGKKPTALQEVQQKRIGSMGFKVFTIDSKHGVDEFIEYCKGLISNG
ncbi:MAG: VRR-NUC domain-containing protein [Bacillota bacterium]